MCAWLTCRGVYKKKKKLMPLKGGFKIYPVFVDGGICCFFIWTTGWTKENKTSMASLTIMSALICLADITGYWVCLYNCLDGSKVHTMNMYWKHVCVSANFHSNKSLVKSPRGQFRKTEILHSLLQNQLVSKTCIWEKDWQYKAMPASLVFTFTGF